MPSVARPRASDARQYTSWDRARLSVVVPIGVIVAVAIVCIVVAVLSSAQRADVVAVDHEKQLFSRALINYGERVLREVESVASSEGAIENIRHSFDPQWAKLRVGTWLETYFDHDYIFIFDRNDTLLYSVVGRRPADTQWFATARPAFASVLDFMRGRDPGLRGAIRLNQQILTEGSAHPQAAIISQLLGRPAVIAASAVGPGRRNFAGLRHRRADRHVGQIHRRRRTHQHRRAIAAHQSAQDRAGSGAKRRSCLQSHRPGRQSHRAFRVDAETARRRNRAQRGAVHRGCAHRLRAARRFRVALHAPHRRSHCGRRIAPAPSRHARSALRPAEPHFLRRTPGGGDRGSSRRQRAGRRVLHRPRSLQGRQRYARPPCRRRADPQRHLAAVAYAARRRSGGAARRRRVRGHLIDRGRQRDDDGARATHYLGDLRALLDQQPEHHHRRLDRHRGDRQELRNRNRHHALRRHGALSRQERRPQPRMHLRCGDGCRSLHPQAARGGPARGDRERPAAVALSADRQQERRERCRRRSALPLDASGSRRDSAERIHRHRRAQRPDHRSRKLGAAPRVHRRRGLAGIDRCGQRVVAPVPAHRFRRGRRADPERNPISIRRGSNSS